MEEFGRPGGVGEVLQQKLLERAEARDSWVRNSLSELHFGIDHTFGGVKTHSHSEQFAWGSTMDCFSPPVPPPALRVVADGCLHGF